MRQLRQILVVMLMAVFLASSVTTVVFAACNCADMASAKEQLEKTMPCHEVQASDTEQTDKQASKCGKCDCGHCKVPSQASLIPMVLTANDIISKALIQLHQDMSLSVIAYGIDNPPKPIS